MAATIHTNKVRRQEHLRRSFSILDKDKSGTITHDELTEACKEWDISEAEVTQMIRDVDINKVSCSFSRMEFTFKNSILLNILS